MGLYTRGVPVSYCYIANERFVFWEYIDLEEMLLEQNKNNVGNRKIWRYTLNRNFIYQKLQKQMKIKYSTIHQFLYVHVTCILQKWRAFKR
jgi:hypothetical protein